MLHGQVVLERIGRARAQVLANTGYSQTGAKTVRCAGGKLAGVVQEPAIAIGRGEAANKWRIHSRSAIGHKDVITVIELAEACADGPLARSCGIPRNSQPGRKRSIEVVLDSAIGPRYPASPRWARIGTKPW